MEYLLLKEGVFPPKDTSKGLREPLFNSKNANEAYVGIAPIIKKTRTSFLTKIPSFKLVFEKFLTSDGFPNTLFDTDKRVYERIIAVLEKIVYEDLPRVMNVNRSTQSKIFPILNILAGKNENMSYRSLSRDIEELTLSQTSEIINVLAKSGVLNYMSVSTKSIKKQERNRRKYYFASPSIRASILWTIGKFNRNSDTMGLLLENGVFNSLHKTKIYTNLIQEISYPEEQYKSCDFVITTPNGKIVLECGWGIKTSEQIAKTMQLEKAIYGIIVSDSPEKLEENNNVLFIPKEIFFLF
jgi:predicted AAA+ superfamily ATPase